MAQSHIMPGTNCQTVGCNTSRKHKRTNNFKIPEAKSGVQEHINWKEEQMNIEIYGS